MGRYEKLKVILHKTVFVSEVLLALFIVAGVFIGTIDLAKYLIMVYRTPPAEAYDAFKNFLGHTLLLVIGLELVIMLVKHSLESLLEVLTFAIARKLVISVDSYVDLLLGVFALAVVLGIRKYLSVKKREDEY